MTDKIIVLALGGNAISGNGRTIDSQYETIKNVMKEIACLLQGGCKIVVTYGNGPQVGDSLLRNEYARKVVPPLPLFACVAETQGLLGSMIQTALFDFLGKESKVASLITEVEVSAKDPAFNNPTKPIGPFIGKDKIYNIKKIQPLSTFKEISGNYRRVVPSPEPVSILNLDAIKNLIKNNHVVIACGGGGIPVTSKKKIDFVEAVIDKDLSSELLASGIGASMYVNLTQEKGVYENFRAKNKKLLRKTRVEYISELLKEEGKFEEGSMGPKVKSCINFVTKTGKIAVIGSIKNPKKSVELKSGTIIYK